MTPGALLPKTAVQLQGLVFIMLYTAISVLHVCICVLLVLLVLLQQGKGADAGATFGGGSNTLFGAGGADTFLTKATTILAFLFMSTSFALALNAMPTGEGKPSSKLFSNTGVEKTQKPPVGPAAVVSSETSSEASVVTSEISSVSSAPVSSAPVTSDATSSAAKTSAAGEKK